MILSSIAAGSLTLCQSWDVHNKPGRAELTRKGDSWFFLSTLLKWSQDGVGFHNTSQSKAWGAGLYHSGYLPAITVAWKYSEHAKSWYLGNAVDTLPLLQLQSPRKTQSVLELPGKPPEAAAGCRQRCAYSWGQARALRVPWLAGVCWQT